MKEELLKVICRIVKLNPKDNLINKRTKEIFFLAENNISVNVFFSGNLNFSINNEKLFNAENAVTHKINDYKIAKILLLKNDVYSIYGDGKIYYWSEDEKQ